MPPDGSLWFAMLSRGCAKSSAGGRRTHMEGAHAKLSREALQCCLMAEPVGIGNAGAAQLHGFLYQGDLPLTSGMSVAPPIVDPRSYRDDVVADLGLVAEFADLPDHQQSAIIKERLASLDAHRRKGTQVKMCRFANWVDRAAEYDLEWTWTVLRLLHYALSENLVDKCDWAALFQPSAGSAQAHSDKQEQQRLEVSRSNEVVARFRNALKNNVQLSLAMLLEPASRKRARMLFLMVAPIRHWYGRQSRRIRSCPALLGFLKEQVGRGDINVPYRETLGLLSDASVLEKIGLQTSFPSHLPLPDADHPAVAEEDQMAEMTVKYAFALIASRFKRLQFLTHGWSGRQVDFLLDGKQASALKDLFAERDAHAAAALRTTAFWRKASKRSYFHLVAVQQLCRMMPSGGEPISQKAVSHVTQRLSGIGQSKISEDCMNRGRALEKTSSNKQQQPPERLWAQLLDSDMISGLYSYEEPQWQDRVAPQGAGAPLPKGVFNVRLRDSPSWVGDIIGPANKPTSWFSTSATFSNTVYSDNFLMRQAFSEDQWGVVEQGCFLAALAGSHQLALRREGTSEWYMGLGHQHGIVVIAWRCVPSFTGTVLTGFALDMERSPEFLLVADTKWFAVTVRWCSPSSAVAMKRISPASATNNPAISCQVVGQPRRLMEEAAMHAFWEISGAGLKAICRFMGLKPDSQQTDFDRVWSLIEKICPKMPAHQILSVMELRGRKKTQLDDLLMFEEAEDLIDDQDKKSFDDFKKNIEGSNRSSAEFWQSFERKRSAVRAGAAQRGNRAASSAMGQFKNHQGKAIKRCTFPESSISQPEAQLLFPSPVRIYEDRANNRWQGYWPGFCSRSRHFHLHGHVNGLRQLLQWAWQERLDRDGVPVSQCPIEGLFPQVVASGST